MTSFSSPVPAPLWTARSITSRDTLSLRAFSTAAARRAFNSGSVPPILAATMISRTSLPVFCPFLSEATARLACNHWRPIRGSGQLSPHLRLRLGSQRRAQVAFARGRQDGDDDLAFVFGALGDFECGDDVRAGGNADEKALFLRQPAGHRKGVVVADLDALGDLRAAFLILQVKVFRHEPGAGALNFMGAGLDRLAREGLRNNRRILRLDGDGLEAGSAGMDDFVTAGNGAAGAHGGHENVDLAIRVAPEFLGGGLAVDFRVRRILELLGNPRVRRFLGELFGASNGPLHAL